jgi:hypothetical protein
MRFRTPALALLLFLPSLAWGQNLQYPTLPALLGTEGWALAYVAPPARLPVYTTPQQIRDYVGANLSSIVVPGAGTVSIGNVTNGGEEVIGGGVIIGAPTGGAKGLGTLNIAGAVYANGTIGATCPSGVTAATVTVVGGIITHC